MIAALFIFLVVMAFLHFIYEGIIAPTLRMKLKYKMFALRDRLAHRRELSVNSDDPAFDIVARSINSVAGNLTRFTVTKIYSTRNLLRTEKGLAEEIRKRNQLIDRATDPDLREIVKLLDVYLFEALLINCAGFFFWLSPLILVAYMRHRIIEVWSARIKAMVRMIVFVPERG